MADAGSSRAEIAEIKENMTDTAGSTDPAATGQP